MVLAFLRNELEYSRFGFVVSKRLGKATQRNKLKRRMRELVRVRVPVIKPGYDIVIIARNRMSQASYLDIERSLVDLLKTAGLKLDQG